MFEEFTQFEQGGKAQLIQLILTNPDNRTSSESLAKMELSELENVYDVLPADPRSDKQKLEESLDDKLFGW
jgi:hypothetical protein